MGCSMLNDAPATASANLRPGTPEQNCSMCEHFSEGMCKKLGQQVTPQLLCDFFTPTTGQSSLYDMLFGGPSG